MISRVASEMWRYPRRHPVPHEILNDVPILRIDLSRRPDGRDRAIAIMARLIGVAEIIEKQAIHELPGPQVRRLASSATMRAA